MNSNIKKYLAEMVGTMVLVLMGCGAAVSLKCGSDTASVVGTAMAFGLAVVAMAYTIGGISGCHINPAITLGCFLTKRISAKDCGMYMLFQLIGAIIGSLILFIIVKTSMEGVEAAALTGANDVQQGIKLGGGLIVEIFLTCVFVFVVLGATAKTNGATNNLAGLAIGLSLILIHLVGINFTGTSVNPARSIGPALFAGHEPLKHLWVFIVGPFAGGALAAGLWMLVDPMCKCCKKDEKKG